MRNVFACAAVVLSNLVILAGAQGVTWPNASHRVRTDKGVVGGRTVGGVERFLGIPYAAPPVGSLRWRPPVDAVAWDDVRAGTAAMSRCTQFTRNEGGPAVVGSEDCLYLDVHRPAGTTAVSALPVLLFIHGGSNQRGAGSEYDPREIVAKTGILVVTINYRLNVFGFLAHPSLDAEVGDAASGNYGLMDQQAAMRWVQRNIGAFGGDPSNVTMAGESAGGIDACANLASLPAAGLFKRVILQSMYCPAVPHEDSLSEGAAVAAALGCSGEQPAECMRARSPAEVLAAAAPLSPAPGRGRGFSASPNFGGRLLPVAPIEAIRAGQWQGSSVMIGSNRDEAALFLAAALSKTPAGIDLSARTYRFLVARRWGALAPLVHKEYPLQHYRSPFAALAAAAGDSSPLGCEVTSLAGGLSAGRKVFRYEFNDPAAPVPAALNLPSGATLGAYHGAELQYLFTLERLGSAKTAAQQRLSDEMIRYWGNFVKSGDPNGEGLAEWPAYSASGRQLLSLAPDAVVVTDRFDAEHHCGFWNSAPMSDSRAIRRASR